MKSITLVGIFLIILGVLIFANQDKMEFVQQYSLDSVTLSDVTNQAISSRSLLGVMAFMSGVILISEVLKKVSQECDKFEKNKYGKIRHA